MADDVEYDDAFQTAKEVAADHLEAEAIRRAVEGTTKIRTHNGQMIMIPAYTPDGQPIIDAETGKILLVPLIDHEYSDTLLIFLLKAARPAKFRDRYEPPAEDTDDGIDYTDFYGKSKPELKEMLLGRIKRITGRIVGEEN